MEHTDFRCRFSVWIILVIAVISSAAGRPYAETITIDNDDLRVLINDRRLSFSVIDNVSGRIFSADPGDGISVIGMTERTETRLTFSCEQDGSKFPFAIGIELEGRSLVFHINADSTKTLAEPLSFPGPIYSIVKDYYIIPSASGIIQPVTEPYFNGYFPMWGYKATMAFAGITDLTTGYIIISEDPWDTQIEVKKPLYSPYHALWVKHFPSKGRFGYNRTLRYEFFSSGGYIEMCRIYRRHAESKGYVKTFREKAVHCPAVDCLLGAVDLWLSQSMWTTGFLDTLEQFGFDKVLVSLPMNWNVSEHIPEFISHATGKGYLVSRYDCLTDIYPPTYPGNPNFRTEGYPEDVIIEQDGSMKKGWVTVLEDGTNFQGYYTCATTHERYAVKKIATELMDNPYNARFMDVQYASTLNECWSPLHPLDRHGDALYRTKAMQAIKERFSLVLGAEEARDFGFPVTDYGEGTMTIVAPNGAGYDWWTPVENPGSSCVKYSMSPVYRVPLHGLVYHDVHVPTWYTGDGFSKTPAYWEDKELLTLLYGAMPLFAVTSLYDWYSQLDKFVTSYHLISAVSRRVGHETMTGHESLTVDWTVQKTTFSNGWSVVANFGKTDFSWDGKTLPPKGFYASSGNEAVYRIIDNGDKIAVARLEDRLFVNPYGSTKETAGIKASGAFFLGKHAGRLSLALVGTMSSIEIDPAHLPWPLANITVTRTDKNTAVLLADIGGGRYRLDIPRGVRFFSIEGEKTDIGETKEQTTPSTTLKATVSPNPFNGRATLTFIVSDRQHVVIELFNILGQKVMRLAEGHFEAGSHAVTIDGESLTSGVYFAGVRSDNTRVVVKATLIK